MNWDGCIVPHLRLRRGESRTILKAGKTAESPGPTTVGRRTASFSVPSRTQTFDRGFAGLKLDQIDTKRRRLLQSSVGVAITALAGCGGGSDASLPVGVAPSPPAPGPTPPPAPPPAPSPAPPPPGPAAWVPYVPALVVGSGATFDLSSTLPPSVNRGGIFGIDMGGSRLPTGMTLSTRGILSVGTAAIGTITGVIFTYDAP